MGTKSTTTVTFAVKMQVPKGSNAQAAETFIHDALLDFSRGSGSPPQILYLEEKSFTVSLLKKETVYGKN